MPGEMETFPPDQERDEMSEEKPPTDEIDDAWLKRREDWCAANVNNHNAAGYAAELMSAMCARIRADGKRIVSLEKVITEANELVRKFHPYSEIGHELYKLQRVLAALEDKTK